MSIRIRLNNVRLSYPQLFVAKSFDGQPAKFSAQFVLPKDHPQIGELKKAIIEVAKEKWPNKVKGDTLPSGLHSPLRDGDEKSDERPELTGMFFMNAGSKERPVVIDKKKEKVDPEEGLIYPGCYVNAIIGLYAFDVSGNRGIAAGLSGVQFKRDGGRLGGGGCSVNDFDVEPDDEESVDLPY